MTPQALLDSITRQARDEPDSGIVKAAMYGFAKPGVIPLWSGEGNIPTPELFSRPAIDSLLKGETFYTWQRGIPELRDALARYHSRHFGRAFEAENFFVTSGGMQAIQTIIQMIAGEGDEIVLPTPAWPNSPDPARPGIEARRSADGFGTGAGTSTSTGCSRRSARAPGRSASRRPIRWADGKRMNSSRCATNAASAGWIVADGSIRASIGGPKENRRRPSSISATPRRSCCSPIHFKNWARPAGAWLAAGAAPWGGHRAHHPV
jgi:hypothetical protein